MKSVGFSVYVLEICVRERLLAEHNLFLLTGQTGKFSIVHLVFLKIYIHLEIDVIAFLEFLPYLIPYLPLSLD